MVDPYYDPGPMLKSPLDLLKSVCPVCGALYWRGSKARDCCKGTPAYNAWKRQIDQRVATAKAAKRGDRVDGMTVPPRAGLGLKPCPRCKGETGHWNCPLCNGCGQVPSNML